MGSMAESSAIRMPKRKGAHSGNFTFSCYTEGSYLSHSGWQGSEHGLALLAACFILLPRLACSY